MDSPPSIGAFRRAAKAQPLPLLSTTVAAAHAASRVMHLPAIFESPGSKGGKGGGKGAPRVGIVCDADTAAMRSHDLADDGEAEAGAFLLFAPAAPEPFENVLSILWRHAAAAIGHFNPTGTIDLHGHFRSSRRVNDRVLNQISQCILERVSVCFHVHWPLGFDERNCLLLRDGPGRHRSHNRGCDFVEIDGAEFERYGVQPSDAKELLDEPVHARD